MQNTGCQRDRCSLNDQREDGDEEDGIEEDAGMFETGNQRIGGEDDGYCSTQTDPRDVELAFQIIIPIGQQAKEDTDRTGNQNHEDTNDQADVGHGQQLVWVDQQSQGEEHHDLPQPGETVEEGSDILLVNNACIADDQPS